MSDRNCSTCEHIEWNPRGGWYCLLRKMLVGTWLDAEKCVCDEWGKRGENNESSGAGSDG